MTARREPAQLWPRSGTAAAKANQVGVVEEPYGLIFDVGVQVQDKGMDALEKWKRPADLAGNDQNTSVGNDTNNFG